jgi:hypothetical protein
MTEKQIKMVRAVLNEHINVNLELLERKDLSASDKKDIKAENEALQDALKVVSKAID